MRRGRVSLSISIIALLLLSTLLLACGDPTATTVPTTSQAIATKAPTTTVAATTTAAPATTAVVTTTAALTTTTVAVIPALPGYIETQTHAVSPAMPKTPRGIVGNTPDIGYWLDGDNNAILKIDKDGNLLLQWGKKGSEDGQLNLPARYVPQGMAIDNQNRLFVADTLNNRVQVFNTEGKFLAKWGSQGKADGQFSNPESILVAPDGNVYVADENRIQKFDSNGTFLFKFATKGSDEGQVVGQVYQMDNDLNGNIYILDQMNKSLMKFDNTGKFMVKFGGLGEADGSFMMPFSEAVDAQGNIYVADYTLQTIQKFDTNGKFAGKWLVKDTAGKPLVPVWLTIDKAKAQITVATSNSGPTLTYKLP